MTWIVAGATFAFAIAFSAFEYLHLRRQIIDEGFRRTRLVLAAVESVQDYVRDVLRPRLRESLPPHEFLPEGMSTTYVARSVIERFLGRNPDYSFKFAALAPRNPLNLADAFERRMIQRFADEPGLKEWRGKIHRDAGEFLASVAPIYVERSCLKCHGNPENAPERLLELYGADRGFGWREGEVAGLRSVSVPVGVPLAEARRMLFWKTLLAFGGILVLFAGTGWVFRQQVAIPLESLEAYAKGIGEGEEHRPPGDYPDNEIGLLGRTIEEMDRQVREKTAALESRNRELVVARDELRSAHRYLERLVHMLPEGVLVIEDDRTVSDINAAACELLQVRPGEAIGRPCRDLFASWDKSTDGPDKLCTIQSALEGGEARLVLKLRSGEKERFLEATASLLPALGSSPQRVLAVLRDVTASVQDLSVVEEKSAQLESFVHALGHDLRAPLANLSSFLQLLQEGGLPSEKVAHFLGRMRFNTDVMTHLINDLLELSRIGIRDEPREDVGSGEVVGEALRVLETQIAERGVTVAVQEGLPRLSYPRSRLLQVFTNLVGNALDHSGEVSGLHIEIGCRESGDSGVFTFLVRDNGQGIDPAEQESIFLPFSSKSKKSTGSSGLGLAIVRRLVEKNGGRVWVESSPGAGATFLFSVPT